MTGSSAGVKALMVYAIAVPLAILMGTMLADPGRGDYAIMGMILVALCIPLLLKWDHALLLFCWNTSAVLFFLPGDPPLWLAAAFGSLGMAVLRRSLLRESKFIMPLSVVLPVLFLGAVVLVTAWLTGGIGIAALGSQVVGGKRYIFIIGAIVGFFALLGRRVPSDKAMLAVGLFFLGGLTNMVGSLVSLSPTWMYWVFYLFPPTLGDIGAWADTGVIEGVMRFYGFSIAGQLIASYLLARYGVREVLERKRFWPATLFILAIVLGSLGGFRGAVVFTALLFGLVFYLEGLFRSRYALVLLAAVVVGGALLIPGAKHLPLPVQRSLSLLPLDIDPIARLNAEETIRWRVEMWKRLVPEIPRYLWLGKGLAMSNTELELANELVRRQMLDSVEVTIMSGDYHNGPLTTIIPFGIWGAIGAVWFFAAAMAALVANFRYGDQSLRKINGLLLALFAARLLFFLVIFGNFYTDFAQFIGILGLNLSINGGIAKRVMAPQAEYQPIQLRSPNLRPQTAVQPA